MRDKCAAVNLISKGSSLKLYTCAESKSNCYPSFALTIKWGADVTQSICEHACIHIFKNLYLNSIK